MPHVHAIWDCWNQRDQRNNYCVQNPIIAKPHGRGSSSAGSMQFPRRTPKYLDLPNLKVAHDCSDDIADEGPDQYSLRGMVPSPSADGQLHKTRHQRLHACSYVMICSRVNSAISSSPLQARYQAIVHSSASSTRSRGCHPSSMRALLASSLRM